MKNRKEYELALMNFGYTEDDVKEMRNKNLKRAYKFWTGRVEKHKQALSYKEEDYYIIEEYQSAWNRWMCIGDTHYLKKHGCFYRSGWDKYGNYSITDLEYAKELLNDLKEALNNGTLFDNLIGCIKEASIAAKITDFRLVKVHTTYAKELVE